MWAADWEDGGECTTRPSGRRLPRARPTVATEPDSERASAQGPSRTVGTALEVIPRTLAQNCGANIIRVLTKLRAKHAEAGGAGATFGIDGNTGARARRACP